MTRQASDGRAGKMRRAAALLLAGVLAGGCATGRPAFRPVEGFSAEANRMLDAFLDRTAAVEGRKVAVFDGDGTVLGQAPHYLADECLYQYAQAHPDRKPEVIARMVTMRNVSVPYVQERVHFFAGETLQAVRNLGEECFRRDYAGKIFEPMRRLIGMLQASGFEVWIVSGSPEALYQKFLARELGIPITRVIGVKSVVRDGIITDEMVSPVPQDEGKKLAIETFIQERPLLVAGNSRGDKEMIELGRELRIMVNPDEHVEPDQQESIASYARKNGWLIVHIPDVPAPGFPAVSSKVYKIRLNRTVE